MAAAAADKAGGTRPGEGQFHLVSLAKFAGKRGTAAAPEEISALARKASRLFECHTQLQASSPDRGRLKEVCEKLRDCLFGWLRLVAHDEGIVKDERWNQLMTTIAHAGANTLEILEALEPQTMDPAKLRAVQKTEGGLEGWLSHHLQGMREKLAEVQELPEMLSRMTEAAGHLPSSQEQSVDNRPARRP